MKILFTAEEVREIITREAGVLIESYHVGEFKCVVERDYGISEITIDVELIPYVEPECDMVERIIEHHNQEEEFEITDPLDKSNEKA